MRYFKFIAIALMVFTSSAFAQGAASTSITDTYGVNFAKVDASGNLYIAPVSISNLPVTGNVVQSFAYPPLSSSVTPAGYFSAGATNWSQTIPLTFKNPGGYTKFYLYASNGNAATGANGCYVRVTGSFTDYSGISTAISASSPFGSSYAFGSASNPESSIGSTVLGVGQSAIPSAVSISLLIGNNGVLNGCNLLTVAANGSVQVTGIWVP